MYTEKEEKGEPWVINSTFITKTTLTPYFCIHKSRLRFTMFNVS